MTDRGQGVAIGVAAYPGVQASRVVLFARHLGVGVADVLEEQQLSAWAQYPRDLRERAVQVGDTAQGEGHDRGVERAVRERQGLARGVHDLYLAPAGAPVQSLAHARVRLDQAQPGHRRWVVSEVSASPGADLDRRAGGLREQSMSILAEPRALGTAGDPVVDSRIEGLEHRVFSCQS